MKTVRLKKAVKVLGIVVLIGLVLFFLFDSILMPLYVQKGKVTKFQM